MIGFAEMQKGELMFKVPYGQDPYSAIGRYIRENITAIEDIIAVIDIDGVETNELFLVDMQEDGYFVWKSDWYEGEQNIALIDFFPVSEAEPERKKGEWVYGETDRQDGWFCSECGGFVPWDYNYYGLDNINFIADFKTCPFCDARMISYTGKDMKVRWMN